MGNESYVSIDLPMNVLRHMSPGEMAYASYITSSDNVIYPCLCIKETAENIIALKDKNVYEIRMGMFTVDNVALVPFMIRVNDNIIYETWINYCVSLAKSYMRILSESDCIDIFYFNQHNVKIRRQFVRFPLTEQINWLIKIVRDYKEWTIDEFDIARDKFCADCKYDTVEKLWDALD